MPLTPLQALQALSLHPKTFLERHPVRIAGQNQPSGVLMYQFNSRNLGASTQRPGSILRTHRMHGTEAFSIDTMPGGTAFLAHSVQMVSSAIAPIALYTLPAAGGPNIMVTGALSGCSFIANAGAAGGVDCAHLQPIGETAQQLQTRLSPNYTVVYGVHDYAHTVVMPDGPRRDRNVTILGVRRGGQWKIYAQKLDILNSYSIRSVQRIYPA